jgi:hypothetical protein
MCSGHFTHLLDRSPVFVCSASAVDARCPYSSATAHERLRSESRRRIRLLHPGFSAPKSTPSSASPPAAAPRPPGVVSGVIHRVVCVFLRPDPQCRFPRDPPCRFPRDPPCRLRVSPACSAA